MNVKALVRLCGGRSLGFVAMGRKTDLAQVGKTVGRSFPGTSH